MFQKRDLPEMIKKHATVKSLYLFLLILLITALPELVMCQPVTPQISAGNLYSIALKSDGTLWRWGSNSFGRLGDGTLTWRYSPVQGLPEDDWEVISHSVDVSTRLSFHKHGA